MFTNFTQETNRWLCDPAPVTPVPHLAQRGLHLAQEVVVPQLGRGVVQVVHLDLHLLHFLKEVVDHKALGEAWVQVVFYIFCPSYLLDAEVNEFVNSGSLDIFIVTKHYLFEV